MVQIHSRQLGEMEVNPEDILDFPNGIPGFERHRRFILVEQAALSPIVFLQCVDAPEVCFFTAPIAAIDATYELAVLPEDLQTIGAQVQDKLISLAVLASAENGQWAANLLAPILIEPRNRRGVQAVRVDSRYSHRHPIGPEASCS